MFRFRKLVAFAGLAALLALIPIPSQAWDDPAAVKAKLIQFSEACDSAATQPLFSQCQRAEYLVEFESQEAQARFNQQREKDLTAVVESALVSAFELSAWELSELALSREVVSITRNFALSSEGTQFNPDWHLDRIDQAGPELDSTYNFADDALAAGVRVYIVDTGINTSHQEFAGRIIPGYSSIGASTEYEDCSGHGTHVAALAAGATVGTARQADIVPVRVLDCAGSGTLLSVLMGLQWIAENTFVSQPAVVNMSLGGPEAPLLDSAISSLIDQGLAFVVAAGNTTTDACQTSPAKVPGAITVASSDQGDGFSSFSNFGPCVDVIAPGGQVRSAWIGESDAYAAGSGTSMASGIVAGLVANQMTLGHKSPAELDQTLEVNALTEAITSVPAGTPNKFVTNGFLLSDGAAATSENFDPVQLPADSTPVSVAPITEPEPEAPPAPAPNPGPSLPPTPSAPVASIDGTTVTLSWEPAAESLNVEKYLLRISSSNTLIRDVEVSAGEQSLVLTDLAPGVVYTAQLAYASSVGTGGYSSPSEPFSFQRPLNAPTAGEFSAWTKMLANGTQVKFYAKYPKVDQKIQFMVQRPDGTYRELAWLRIEADDLTETGEYKSLTNGIYFVRTVNLNPGKNRLRILVNGEMYLPTRTYTLKS